MSRLTSVGEDVQVLVSTRAEDESDVQDGNEKSCVLRLILECP